MHNGHYSVVWTYRSWRFGRGCVIRNCHTRPFRPPTRFGRFANLYGSVAETTHDAAPQITTARGTQERQPPQFSSPLHFPTTKTAPQMDHPGLHALDSAFPLPPPLRPPHSAHADQLRPKQQPWRIVQDGSLLWTIREPGGFSSHARCLNPLVRP
jgi:hypothetical protein